ncbi:MAG TPA: AIPR family protein [Macellibacteroides fermentans]|uniref:AIPR family protein n=1 Tax=Macellibacteroides fermentans TaxID=879969 RepID=UPI002C46D027|nr:AIPR family protein [Macellibacteroides fermentans]
MSIFNVLESNIRKSSEDYSQYLSEKKGDILKGSEFMFYSLSNIFKDKDIEEIEIGIVDSSYRGETYDFGIDAVYIVGSNDFIEQIEELEDYNKDTIFKIHIFQFKRGTGISHADLLKLNSGILRVLVNEDICENDNLYFFNRMRSLNEIKNRIFTNFPINNIKVNIHIVFGGLESNIHTERILDDELNNIKHALSNNGYINSEIFITDCQSLINNPSNSEQIVDIVEYQKTFKYITDTEGELKLNGYISIINGKEIAELVRKHQSAIFEANIRDYYKRNDLNSKILETSASPENAKFFWSFNNGLTMTCSKVEEMPGNKYKLHNLQIVNGCQTSNAIYLALKNKERITELEEKIERADELSKIEKEEYEQKKNLQFNDETSLLVKIIETKDEDLIYRITETTNSQTPIKAFSLKANDDSQKHIEKYLADKNINYERRINSLKNKGLRNIVSLQKLFQLYTAQILFKPSQVRTNPRKMFISTYDDVFPAPQVKIINFTLYLIPIKVDFALNKAIKDYTKNNSIDNYRKTLLSNGKYHLGCFLLSSILKGDYNEKGIILKERYIIEELENNYIIHFEDAINNFEKILKANYGIKKESISSSLKKTELDTRIVRYIKNRK